MILDIVGVKDPVLRQKAKPVKKLDKKIKKLIADMIETLEAQKDPQGVGLAAPQVGKSLQIFIMKPDKNSKVVINPKLISVTKLKKKEAAKKTKILEGCLSLPFYYGPLVRPKKVTISYTNRDGKEVEETFKEFPAQVVLHELDHLEGILFVDKLLEQGKPLYENDGSEWFEVELV